MDSHRSLDGRFELARRFALPVSAALWISSALITCLNVSGTWLVPMLAFSLLATALPTKTISKGLHPAPWTAVGFACALAFVGGVRATIVGTSDAPLMIAVVMLCGEAVVAVFPLAFGTVIDGALLSYWERGRGHMRYASMATMIASTAFIGLALSRFPARVEPTREAMQIGKQLLVLGVFQPLGSRCPTRCDENTLGARRDGSNLLLSSTTDRIFEEVTLERTRVGPFYTRARMLLSPEGAAPRYVFDRVLPPGQSLRVSTDPSRRYLMVDFAQHPRTIVRLSDGVIFTEDTRKSANQSSFHAPSIYVLTALSGLAVAAWLLVEARRTRRSIGQQEGWRDARIDERHTVQFEEDLPPTPAPAWLSGQVGKVVVTSLTAPVGQGYRSDGQVTIHGLFEGTRSELVKHLTARATVLEHAALASVALTVAPLVGVFGFGEAW